MRSSSCRCLLALGALAVSSVVAEQTVLFSGDEEDPYTRFHNVKRVAVIGAGVAGLQAAAALIERNFTVRLFEKAPGPGGNWLYTEEVPVRESYPDAPVDQQAWVPARLPAERYYTEGEDGLTLDERWREHWQPRPVWDSLHTNSPAVITELVDVPYPPDAPWVISAHRISAHVRAYASLHRLNANDGPSDVLAYATRVERVAKRGGKWALTLRRLKRLEESDRVRAAWWEEEFDAVVVATGPYDTPHVPEIEGLVAWSKVRAVDDPARWSVYHSRVYRTPQRYSGKVVLIVGIGTSGSEIARDIAPFAKKIYASHRKFDFGKLHPFQKRSIGRFPDSAEFVPEIKSFGELESVYNGIVDGKITLVNGTVLQGVDEIILATGYSRSSSLLLQLYNGTIGSDPNDVDVFDGARLKNVHWTGHFIPDPTLAFTNVRPWTLGKIQSYALAKVWEGTARIPSQAELWRQYNSTRYSHFRGLFGTGPTQALERQYVAWLNSESLELGGRFVDQWPLRNREVFAYYANQNWQQGYISRTNFTRFEELPADKWTDHESWAVSYDEDIYW